MKKTILVWATVMAAGMLALSGCGKKETGQAGEYTNLADKESRKSVVGELEACGVTKEQTATLENGQRIITRSLLSHTHIQKDLRLCRKAGWITAPF